MRTTIKLFAISFYLVACAPPPGQPENVADALDSYQHFPGFYDLYWDESAGRLILEIEETGVPFLYQSSLARGVGSNDIGLDRGQLGSTKVVEFERSGPKLLLIEDNLDYRASGDNVDEQNAVAESFARAVIWGFEAIGERDGAVYVDATEFLLRDAHSIAPRLAELEEGEFVQDQTRSAIYLPNTKAFPDNSEIEAIVTFTGQAIGEYLPTVTPDEQVISVHLHHSLIRLPDDDYEPLPFEPRSGFFGRSFQDYAVPVGESITVNYGRRHRLGKVDPAADSSEAVEPIVYYVDRGAPEPIRTALVEGAQWWNQAFEAAGYKDAFRVELLPEGADPMDVRYNVIQWVHRSTRGWSYGGSIADPRTGEIMKGKVTLGSLRVRQDYLIAEGLLGPYDGEEKPDAMLRMSLARIRQLSAHEVGHTLGIQHNMAASTQDRASVMDYPHPLIEFDAGGAIDLENAYAEGIGEWDKRVILYGYQDFPDDVDADRARQDIMTRTIAAGHVFVSDSDSRAIGSAHPKGNLWDNGADAIDELQHLMRVREHALARFSENNIRVGEPLATLEEVLVPLYLLHRFQLIAVGKFLGGFDFSYTLRGDGQDTVSPVDANKQESALTALLSTIDPDFLRIPENVLALIPPRPPGFDKSRETFPTHTGAIFEQMGAATSAATLTLDVLLEPSRAARMIQSSARHATPGFSDLLDKLLEQSWFARHRNGIDAELQRAVNSLVLEKLMVLTINEEADPQVRALAYNAIVRLNDWLQVIGPSTEDKNWSAHYEYARFRITRMREDPASIETVVPVTPPPGEPIGAANM